MAYDRKKLSGSVGVGASAPTFFVYKSVDDARATIEAANYFNGSADVFLPNDLIMCNAADGFAIYRIVSNNGTTVVIAVVDTEV